MNANWKTDASNPLAPRVVTFTRCQAIEHSGRSAKIRGTIKLWIRGDYDPGKAVLTMRIDGDEPKLDLNPMPADFSQDRDLISHGMEMVGFIEAESETEYFYEDPALAASASLDARLEPAPAPTAFDKAVAKIAVGPTEKDLLKNGGTTAIGRLQ